MSIAPPENEKQRLDALRSYRILDTVAEQSYDDFTLLASTICKTPIAVISLVDADRQWFKSKIGLDFCQSSRDISFCTHVIHRHKVLIIPDALEDKRFKKNPMVTGPLGIRFYAGAPLLVPGGHAIGTLCVYDRLPRGLSVEQTLLLEALARQIVAQLELRKALAAIKTLRGLLPICSYCKSIRNDDGYWNTIETYISRHSDAELTHGICPDCYQKLHVDDEAVPSQRP
jgi:GAF domain-containing protein